ncbi:hypothetical protein [Maritalea mediterranea]|uniref:Uncharacterized protein n=1 Tax=Maritalea mediterranea TaxID=2909667 RepID=A0ABS9EA37_9HYPH|nr:hypothetical protein [Maritalea mediterranea]MCF4099707.1 hypothetical protein [Maritalea mediterranea]
MADYKELLRRAINALPENNGTARRAVYEKARSALVTQLHAIEPPIPPREITQHRLTLEDCIRQVEQEATEKLLQGLSSREKEAAVEEAVPTPSMPDTAETDDELSEAERETAPDEMPDADDGVAEHATTDEAAPADDKALTSDREEPNCEDSEPDSDDDATDDSFEHAPIEDDFDTDADPSDHGAEEQVAEAARNAEADEPAEDEPVSDEAGDETEELPDEAPIVSENAAHPLEASKGSQIAESAPDMEDAELEAEAVGEPDRSDDAERDEGATQDDDFSPADEDELAEQLEEIETNSGDYTASSIDDVIAQARAASGMDAPTPDVSGARGTPSNTNVEAALSSVREVDVDPADLAGTDADDDDAQAAIDRALMALDREAEGKNEAGADDALMGESSKGAIAAATKKGEPELVEDPPEFVEDEQTGGGGGLLVFLGVFVLLLGLLGGGTYWAWREGYVNLDPMLKQIGLSEFIPPVAESAPANGNGASSATEETIAPETNVRDVTQDNNVNANVAESPAASEEIRLTPEDSTPATDGPAADSQTAPSNRETTPAAEASTGDSAATTEPGSGETSEAQSSENAEANEAATDDSRLPSEGDSATTGDNAENALNVQDPNPQASVGAQSLLIEEQSSGSGGAVPFSGQTEWSRDVDELGLPIIRATASIPARNLSVDLLIRKNSDEALPASHLIEVNFSVTESFLGGSIASLPGVLMKDQELAQGTTLVGASVRVVDNSFLFAMSGAENDVARNLELLGQNGWLDLPLIYGTGRKAILTLEKGAAGTEIFENVLAEWAEN